MTTIVRDVGRPPLCPPEVARIAATLREQGLTYAQISDQFNDDGILTPSGNPEWSRTTVWHLVRRNHAKRAMAESLV